ncbi:MAG: hypothetical protein JWN98_1776 [Abditibacteriota bacterium]|nr:hypothetical protein [Abditibacteriota bacterium]
MRRRGFTLVEILLVLAIIGILAALLLPVFNSVRGRARQAACASNLRQIGLGVTMYTQDNDGRYPHGGDPTDINTDAWQSAFGGQFAQDAKELRPLPLVLQSYIKNSEIWRCPADIGFDYADTKVPIPLKARPTSFAAFNTSYYYRTELTLRRRRNLTAFETKPPYTRHEAADINMIFDGKGNWHGGGQGDNIKSEEWRKGRYNVLMADGRVTHMTADEFNAAWSLKMVRPAAPDPVS